MLTIVPYSRTKKLSDTTWFSLIVKLKSVYNTDYEYDGDLNIGNASFILLTII